jgi:hypothetical protein
MAEEGSARTNHEKTEMTRMKKGETDLVNGEIRKLSGISQDPTGSFRLVS